MRKTFNWFRKTGIAEGFSFLILIFIAMPLKYFANMPMAVTIVGGLHGVLFVAFIYLTWEAKTQYKKPWKWFIAAILASFLPFGTIIMDKQWKKEEQDIYNANISKN